MTGATPAEVTGLGTGIDAAARVRKVERIETAVSPGTSPIRASDAVLGAVGGLETARCFGLILRWLPHVCPWSSTGLSPAPPPCLRPRSQGIAGRSIAAHQSIEPGHAILLDRLGLRLLLDLDLRLGEGTGAALAFQSIDAAVRVRDEMAPLPRPPSLARLPPGPCEGHDRDVLVRHAATTWSGRRYCGRSDPSLSTAGRAAARALAATLVRPRSHETCRS